MNAEGGREQSAARWRVNADASNDEVYPVLVRDPVWNCFALADLEPPLRAYSQFVLASRGASSALCLILRHPVLGEVVSPSGEEEGIAAILQAVALPERPLLQVYEAHISLLQRYYRPETDAGWRRLQRMAITSTSWCPCRPETPRPIRQLTAADVPALQAFYTRHGQGRFSAALFAQNLFFGAYEDTSIVAAGGTHVLAHRSHLAVLGAILTAPDRRRQGYATAITSALVAQLFAQGFPLVLLNVLRDNGDAIRVYRRLGFQTQYQLVTGMGVRRPECSGRVLRQDLGPLP